MNKNNAQKKQRDPSVYVTEEAHKQASINSAKLDKTTKEYVSDLIMKDTEENFKK